MFRSLALLAFVEGYHKNPNVVKTWVFSREVCYSSSLELLIFKLRILKGTKWYPLTPINIVHLEVLGICLKQRTASLYIDFYEL